MDILACFFWHSSFKSGDKLPSEFRCELEEGSKRIEVKLNSCVGDFHFLVILSGGMYAYFCRHATNARRESTGSPGKVLENALSSLTLSPQQQQQLSPVAGPVVKSQPPSPFAMPEFVVPKVELQQPQYATFSAPSPLASSSMSLEFPISTVELSDEVGGDLQHKLGYLEEQLLVERRRSALLQEQLQAERFRVMQLESQLQPHSAWESMLPADDDYLS